MGIYMCVDLTEAEARRLAPKIPKYATGGKFVFGMGWTTHRRRCHLIVYVDEMVKRPRDDAPHPINIDNYGIARKHYPAAYHRWYSQIPPECKHLYPKNTRGRGVVVV